MLALLEGEQATRERRHGGRLGLLSRGPPHDHPHQAAGKHASASAIHGRRAAWLQRRLTDWATDPRTTIPQLRNALEDVLKNEPKPEWDLFAIKVWLSRTHARAGAADTAFCSAGDRRGMDISPRRHGSSRPTWSGHLEAARRFLLREPERSRRVLRLLCANYLAHVETRGRRRGNRPSGRCSLI